MNFFYKCNARVQVRSCIQRALSSIIEVFNCRMFPRASTSRTSPDFRQWRISLLLFDGRRRWSAKSARAHGRRDLDRVGKRVQWSSQVCSTADTLAVRAAIFSDTTLQVLPRRRCQESLQQSLFLGLSSVCDFDVGIAAVIVVDLQGISRPIKKVESLECTVMYERTPVWCRHARTSSSLWTVLTIHCISALWHCNIRVFDRGPIAEENTVIITEMQVVI